MKVKLAVQFGNDSLMWESNGGSFIIGRHPTCSLIFEDADDERQYVSTRHAQIEVSHQGAILSDIGSTNGTYINDVRVEFPTLLHVGDRIGLGQKGPQLIVNQLISLDSTPTGALGIGTDYSSSRQNSETMAETSAARKSTILAGSRVVIGPIQLYEGFEPFPSYRLIRKLGAGAFGEVWLSTAPGDVLVALKFLSNDKLIEMELHSLRLLTSIRHPNLVDVQWIQEYAGALVIAMPYCDGGSLEDLVVKHQAEGKPGIPRKQLLDFTRDAAKAIDFLNTPQHRYGDQNNVGIQHRDIKPANIFVVGNAARVADFGIAKIVVDESSHTIQKGTPRYRAPETWSARVCQQSDQYSLAMSYARLLSGELPKPFPFEHPTVYLNSIDSVLTPSEGVALRRALDADPSHRFHSCVEFLDALT